MPLRSARERLYQTLAFEVGGLCLSAPLYSGLFGEGTEQSLTLTAALSIAVAFWSPVHNTIFDWLDYCASGRAASDRPHSLRLLQACSLELSSVLATLPLVMWIGDHGFLTALAVDAWLTVFYVAYGYFFHIVYDRARPVVDRVRGFPSPALNGAFSDRPTEHFGLHLMIDGYGAPSSILADREY